MIWLTSGVSFAIALAGALLLWLVGLHLTAVLWLAAIFSGFVLYHSYFAQTLQDWLISPQGRPVPAGHGVWGDILDRIARLVSGAQSAQSELSSEIDDIQSAVDLLPDALIVLDHDNVVQWCNSSAQVLLGLFEIGRPIQQFVRHPDFTRYLASANYERPVRIPLPSRPGRTFEVSLHVTAGEKRLLVSRDVTEHARLDNLRTDFVANVSHEIRTPVTVIGGFAETMLDIDLPPEKTREYLDNIVKHSRTMQSLVEDLLVLSSLEASVDAIRDDRINLTDLFAALTAEARDISAGQHTIVNQPPERVVLHASQTEIESAVRNLLTNAIRYTPKDGTITLGWSRRGAAGWISVTDTGIGIAAEHLPRLTERFYRVDKGRSRSTGGTGLGLAIVKRIANRHNANLHIESAIGKGSTFSIIFPGNKLEEVS